MASTRRRREEHEEKEYYEPVTVDTRDLSDHLRTRSRCSTSTPPDAPREEFHRQHQRDGYLACPVEDIRQSINDVVIEGGRGPQTGTR
jgi:RNA polymerase sigma-54 factor